MSSQECREDRISKLGSLSATILEYYNKYGQNRDLEKYLRVRQNYNKSSSEGSLQIAGEMEQLSIQGKSLENIKQLRGFDTYDDSEKTTNTRENSKTNEQFSMGSTKHNSVSPKQQKHQLPDTPRVRITKKLDNLALKSKKLNFNLESSIEFSLNTPYNTKTNTGSCHELTDAASNYTGCQTPVDLDYRNISMSSQNDTNQTTENKKQVSPASSLASNRKGLEWDSLADIGYATRSSIKTKSIFKTASEDVSKSDIHEKELDSDQLAIKSKVKETAKSETQEEEQDTVNNEIVVYLHNEMPNNVSEATKIRRSEKEMIINESEISNPKITSTPKDAPIILVEKSVQTNLVENEHLKSMSMCTNRTDNLSTSSTDFEFQLGDTNYSSTTTNSQSDKENKIPISLETGCFPLGSSESSSSKQFTNDNSLTRYISVESKLTNGQVSVTPTNRKIKKIEELDADLRIGIDLLKVLAETKNLNRDMRKRLVRLLTENLIDSSSGTNGRSKQNTINSPKLKNHQIEMSTSKESSNLTNSLSTHTRSEVIETAKLNVPVENENQRSWLEPLTNSEKLYQKRLENNNNQGTEIPTSKKYLSLQSHQHENSINKKKFHDIEWLNVEIKQMRGLRNIIMAKEIRSTIINSDPNIITIPPLSNLNKSPHLEKKQNITNYGDSEVSWNSHKNHIRNHVCTNSSIKNDELNDVEKYAIASSEEFLKKYCQREKTTEIIYSNTNSLQHISVESHSRTTFDSGSLSSLSYEKHNNLFISDTTTESKNESVRSLVAGTGVQTTDSLLHTEPICELFDQNLQHPSSVPYLNTKRTVKIDKTKNNKQIQTIPQSVAYVLTFNKTKIDQVDVEKINTHSSDSSAKQPYNYSRESLNSKYIRFFNDLKLSDEVVPNLQEFLKQKRPDFIQKAEKRREIINEIIKTRRNRINLRIELLETASNLSFENALKKLPSQPLSKYNQP